MPFVRRLYFPLLLLLIFFYAFRPLEGGDDFWAHAAIGRIVLDTGHIPKRTVYLWSADVPWVFHAYGAGVLYALLLRLGGPWLCLWLNFALAAIPFALVWQRAKKRAGEVPSALVVLLVAAIYFSQIRWHLRPEAFTVLFLTFLLLFLTAQKRATWMYFAVAAMFALWPNLHGGVLIGILTLWAGALCQLFDGKSQTRTAAILAQPETPWEKAIERPAKWRLFALALACPVLALLCNPWRWGYIRVFAGTEATAQHISEWRPFWAFPPMSREAAWGLCALWCVAVLVWAFDPKRRVTTLSALLLMGALWIQARRQLWLTSTVCTLALAQSAPVLRGEAIYARLKRNRSAQLDAPMRLIGSVGALIVLIAACFVAAPKARLQAVSSSAPVAMSRFLLTRAPKGRLYNDYEYSAALEWFLNGKRPLYIDLINAYPSTLFDEWFEIAHASPLGLKVLNQKKVDVIALRPVPVGNKDDPILRLFLFLNKSKDWKLIYNARDGRVWTRKKPFFKALS